MHVDWFGCSWVCVHAVYLVRVHAVCLVRVHAVCLVRVHAVCLVCGLKAAYGVVAGV